MAGYLGLIWYSVLIFEQYLGITCPFNTLDKHYCLRITFSSIMYKLSGSEYFNAAQRSVLFVDNLTKYVLIKFGQEHAEILD